MSTDIASRITGVNGQQTDTRQKTDSWADGIPENILPLALLLAAGTQKLTTKKHEKPINVRSVQ